MIFRPRILLALRALLLAGLLASCSSNDPSHDAVPAPSASETTSPSDRPDVIFIDGQTIYRLGRGGVKRLMRVSAKDVTMSTDGRRVAYTTGPAARRIVRGGDVVDGSVAKLGRGEQPVWSPDGSLLAVVAPARGYRICRTAEAAKSGGRGCFEGERVMTYDVTEPNAPPEAALGADKWTIVGWTSEQRVLAASYRQTLALGFPEATFEQQINVAYEPRDVWGISPAAPAVLIHSKSGTEIVDLEDQRRTKVRAGNSRLQEGAWSPDGSTIVTLAASNGRTRLIAITARTGAVAPVKGSTDASGSVVWSSDSEWFAYLSQTGGNSRIVLCNKTLKCRSLPRPLDPAARLLALPQEAAPGG